MGIGTPTSMGTNVISGTGVAQTIGITTTVGAAVGDQVFVSCACGGNASFSINDGHGNTYSQINARTCAATLTTAITAGDVITITTTQTASSMACGAFKTSGLVIPLAVDQASASTSGTSTAMGVGAISATTVADELIIGVFAVTNILAVTFTPASGYTNIAGGTASGNTGSIRLEYKIASATETPAPAATLSSSKAYDGRAFTVARIAVPANSVAPALSGVPHVGQSVSVSTGTWSNATLATYAYQWKADGSDIGGATSSSYTPVIGDLGKSLKVTVTASNATGAGTGTDSDAQTVGAAVTGFKSLLLMGVG